ncbi:MAG TPA: hypothetical protein VF683_09185 [Chthoniobacterales bacterium]|jgi:hypothetical protein
MPHNEDDRVPVFGTWRTAYLAVVVVFVLNVVLFYAFSRYFS